MGGEAAGAAIDLAKMSEESRLSETFRAAMRGLATTVMIVTSRDEAGGWSGITATAVTSVSMQPPSCLVCVNRSASVCEPIAKTGLFCINVLKRSGADLAAAFASAERREERFRDQAWAAGPERVPYCLDAQANIFCDVERSVEFGTHFIFVGRVIRTLARAEPDPLIYCEGRFLS